MFLPYEKCSVDKSNWYTIQWDYETKKRWMWEDQAILGIFSLVNLIVGMIFTTMLINYVEIRL